jgi:hypothetical protein
MKPAARPSLADRLHPVLLVVSLLEPGSNLGSDNLRDRVHRTDDFSHHYFSLTVFDLIIEILITSAILLIGQAAMVYEVFTFFPLPRSGLHKRWTLAIATGLCSLLQ